MKKKSLLLVLLIITISLLTGCTSAETEGHWFHDYFVYPFSYLIKAISQIFNGNYGIAIIGITIIVRLVLMPISLRSAKKQQTMRQKMEIIKPEMDEIQGRLKAAKTKEEQMKAQQELMALYQKHNFNPFAIGCLPMLLQIPIWMGLYYAIRLTPEIADHTFLWFNLGRPDIAMAVIAGIAYYVQFKVSMIDMAPEQQQQMKIMGLLSPVMILFASMSTFSALAVYWTMSGIILIGQTYLTKKLYPIKPAQAVAGTDNSKGNKQQSKNKSNKK